MLESVQDAKTSIHREMIKDELPLFPGVLTFLKAAVAPLSARSREHGESNRSRVTCLNVRISVRCFLSL